MFKFLIRRKILPLKIARKLGAEKGQSFVEFILLMLMIIMISFSFMKIVNTNLGKTWVKMVNVVIKDTNPDASSVKLIGN